MTLTDILDELVTRNTDKQYVKDGCAIGSSLKMGAYGNSNPKGK